MEVCSNPLCRRKWKLLSASALPFVCPSCRKSLDASLARSLHLAASDACAVTAVLPDYLRRVTEHWREIRKEIAETLGFDKEKAVEPRKVRNWSSMGQRKKPSTGTVQRKWRWLSEVVAEERNDFYYFVDWQQEFATGDVVRFIVFPNPSLEERKVLGNLIKVLTENDENLQTALSLMMDHHSNNSETLPDSTDRSQSIDTLLREFSESRRPDWIPDTPATPLYLTNRNNSQQDPLPPTALLELLRH